MTAAAALAVVDADGFSWGRAALAGGFGFGAFLCLGFGIGERHDASRLRRLESGFGAIARWHVSRDTWRDRLAQRARDPARAGMATGPRLPQDVPPDGIEIVLNTEGLFVGREAWASIDTEFGLRARIHAGWLEFSWPVHPTDPPAVAAPFGRDAASIATELVGRFGG